MPEGIELFPSVLRNCAACLRGACEQEFQTLPKRQVLGWPSCQLAVLVKGKLAHMSSIGIFHFPLIISVREVGIGRKGI